MKPVFLLPQLNLGPHVRSGGERSGQSAKANFFSGALAFSQRPMKSFGYTISYQGLATNRTGVNGPLGVGFQPFGGTEQSDFNSRVHTLSARFDLQAGRANSSPAVTSLRMRTLETCHSRSTRRTIRR